MFFTCLSVADAYHVFQRSMEPYSNLGFKCSFNSIGCNSCNHISFTSFHGVYAGGIIVHLVFSGEKARGANQSPPSVLTALRCPFFTPLNVSIIVQVKKIISSHKMLLPFSSDDTVPFVLYTLFHCQKDLMAPPYFSVQLQVALCSSCASEPFHHVFSPRSAGC